LAAEFIQKNHCIFAPARRAFARLRRGIAAALKFSVCNKRLKSWRKLAGSGTYFALEFGALIESAGNRRKGD